MMEEAYTAQEVRSASPSFRLESFGLSRLCGTHNTTSTIRSASYLWEMLYVVVEYYLALVLKCVPSMLEQSLAQV